MPDTAATRSKGSPYGEVQDWQAGLGLSVPVLPIAAPIRPYVLLGGGVDYWQDNSGNGLTPALYGIGGCRSAAGPHRALCRGAVPQRADPGHRPQHGAAHVRRCATSSATASAATCCGGTGRRPRRALPRAGPGCRPCAASISCAKTSPTTAPSAWSAREGERRLARRCAPRTPRAIAIAYSFSSGVERMTSARRGGGRAGRVEERVDADDRAACRRASASRSSSDSSWIRPRWYMRSIAPSTPPRSEMRRNSSSTASSTRSVSSSMMKLPCSGFSFFARPSSWLMMSWIAMRAPHALLGGRGDRLVVGVGVQRVAVVVDRVERLQRGADVVERDLLRVQAAAGGLDVVLELLRAVVGAVAQLHRLGPDAPRHAADHGVLGVDAVGEEERQVGREVVDLHAARQVVLDVGEAVGQREGELRDRIGAGLGDVIAGDATRSRSSAPAAR